MGKQAGTLARHRYLSGPSLEYRCIPTKMIMSRFPSPSPVPTKPACVMQAMDLQEKDAPFSK